METTSGRNLSLSHRLQCRTITVNGDYSVIESNDPDDGDISNPPGRRELRIADQRTVHTDLAVPDLPSHISSESENLTDQQQAKRRLLETRDSDQLSPPSGMGNNDHHDPKTPWHPFYLRKTTSLLFMGVFALMIVGLETLFTISTKRSGLPGGVPFMRYLWSYGTTGIFTLTAAFWHRLDYEAKVAVPWFKASPIMTSKAALKTDYIDTWSLLVPFKAFRNRDWEVSSSSSISLLLQMVIVLSTALFSLVPTNFTNNAEPIFLTSRFVDDPTRLENSESLLPYYIAMGSEPPENGSYDTSVLRHARLNYPEGCTDRFAYQTFDQVSSNLKELNATVDGLTLNLACETAIVEKRKQTIKLGFAPGYSFGYENSELPYSEVTYGGCQTNFSLNRFLDVSRLEPDLLTGDNMTFHENTMMLSGIHGFASSQCNSTNKDDHRLVFLSAEVEWSFTKQIRNPDTGWGTDKESYSVTVDITIPRSVALACKPALLQIPLNISRNSEGVQTVSSFNGRSTNFLHETHPWDFIEFFFDKNIIPVSFDKNVPSSALYITEGNTIVWGDEWFSVILAFCGQSCNKSTELMNETFLEEILDSFFSSYAAATAHVLLRARIQVESTGISSSSMTRLWVQSTVCQVMVALLAVVILIILVTQLEHREMLPCRMSPGSTAATAVFAGRTASLGFPTGLGPMNTKQLHEWLNTSFCGDCPPYELVVPAWTKNKTQASTLKKGAKKECPASSKSANFKNPIPLRPLSRIAFGLATVGCGITLMVLLRKSTLEQGLGDAEGSKYLLYLWNTVPAAILTILSWWMSSIDTQIRLLAPYDRLKRDSCRSSILKMNLMRGLIPTILYQELKSSNLAAALITVAALLGATLTTASAAMIHVVIYPVSNSVELTPQTVITEKSMTYTTPVAINNFPPVIEPLYIAATRSSSLILETNTSYSQEVYQNLVFPTYSMIMPSSSDGPQTTNLSSAAIKATTPALRPRLSCHMYTQADIEALYVRDQPDYWGNLQNGIAVNITGETSCVINELDNKTAFFDTGDLSDFSFAATTSNRAKTTLMGGCSSFLYIWGYHDSSIGRVDNISAVGCNSSLDIVDVNVSLLGPDMRLDPSVAPQAIESTARETQGLRSLALFSSGAVYTAIAPLVTPNDTVFDAFFKALVTSRYAIPISAIGDPTQSNAVFDAIQLQHGILEAQFISTNYRMDINSPNVTDNATNVVMPILSKGSTVGNSTGYPATIIYPFGRQRIAQDRTATIILELLLLSILTLSVLGWWFGPREAALPRGPTSVASVLALLAGGDVLEHIYRDGPEPRSWEDVESRLGKDCRFRLGWGPLSDDEDSAERRFGIWIVNKHG